MEVFIDPLESKRAKIPMMTKWDDIMKKFAGGEWNPIKSAEFMGKPFGSHKIKITPTSTSGMVFRWSKDTLGFILFRPFISRTARKIVIMQEFQRNQGNSKIEMKSLEIKG